MNALWRRPPLRELWSASRGARLVVAARGAALLVALVAGWGTAHGRERVALAEGWIVRQCDERSEEMPALLAEAAALLSGGAEPDPRWLPTRVPAQVHDVLLAHGKIPDPCFGKNATESAWVGDRDWVYATRFRTPSGGSSGALLRFLGLDTLARAYLNGKEIGRFDNMYREWAVDVTSLLAPEGEGNSLVVVFSSPLRHLASLSPPERHDTLPRHKYLRKCHSDFGSYLGARPHSVKVGIFRDVLLDLVGPAWIEDVWVRTEISSDFGSAEVLADVEAEGEPASLSWFLLDPMGKKVASGEEPERKGAFRLKIPVEKPELWWPWTHGTPSLYVLVADLKRGGSELEREKVRFGIRKIEPVLRDSATGEPRFQFNVNGRAIFLRGACWAPLEGRTQCWDSVRACRLLDLAVHGRMNVLRVWGEGHIPPPHFYDECDRRGILIWQDFMFGYGMHPSGEPEFDASCKAEVEDMLRRLRNHPSILLWCGGNENHMGWDFRWGTKPEVGLGLFEKILPDACARLDPTRLFHPSSPHGGPYSNWPLAGDWHDYSTLKFCPEASVPLFASEVGRVSSPSVASLRRFIPEKDLWPPGHDPSIRVPGQAAWPPFWQYRSVDGSWDKVGPLERYCDPRSAEDLVRVLGMAHGEYLRKRVERERRGVPDGAAVGTEGRAGADRRCWGNMVWRLNDSWPIIYWSVIDYYLEPKIPFYLLRRAYDPVLVSFEETPDRIAVWVTNDSPEPISGMLRVKRRRFDGRTLGELSVDVRLEPGASTRCLVLTDLGTIVKRSELLEAALGERVATHLLIGERYLHLPKARLEARFVEGDIQVKTDAFARAVSLSLEDATGAVFEDSFFDLLPGSRRRIQVRERAGGKRVRVSALNAEPVTLELEPEGP